jgi:nucleotide-binding universal stress UspA family protein
MTETMVVGVDGTADSLGALSSAAELAEESGASLVLLHVRHDSGIAAGSLEAGAEVAMSEALDQAEKTSRERASEVLSGRSLRWRFDVAFGDPATELIAAARHHQAGTIVVGGRSHGVIGGLVVGSVAQKLVRHSPVSVLVVRDGHAHRLEAASTFTSSQSPAK